MTTAASTTSVLRSSSAIVAVTESGQHLLRIDGYSHTLDIPTGSNIKSQPFRVGGHSWRISYYPNGLSSTWSDYISLFLRLDDGVPQGVRARHTFSLLDREGRPPVTRYTNDGARIFTDLGTSAFIRRSELERSEHLRDDCFTIRCDVTVLNDIQTKSIDVGGAALAVPVPPSDLHRHLGGLLATGEAADVAFEVDGKTFMAHRCVLMARSPVFRAELSGLQAAKESAAAAGGSIAVPIKDMEAQDFEALLHYVYTDSLPEVEEGQAAAMLPDLIAAANRYKMERLRLLCEDKLREFVDARTVAIILAFAGEHHCQGLKEACLRFLNDPENLREVVKINGFEHLTKSCLSVLEGP
ncbi:BTB/POZ and MATH domain-containing protein 1 [Dichanthelium oligosanthes]|uniref:BTB/POZ and MATH domain-containing protein 1 n=1 Tax=Dichanthelium oligosanthes TaxID=888268 RepID=A0A1E5UY05_9POAL|nr:BTB/POZ and MATH domain-containing protein 1 [Dichanthelium oligosanthes]